MTATTAPATASTTVVATPVRRVYEFISGKHSRPEPGHDKPVLYVRGDRILMTNVEAATHALRIRLSPDQTSPVKPASLAAAEVAALPVPEPEINSWASLLDNNGPTIIAAVRELEDLGALNELLETETGARNRSGVLRAINARIAALTPVTVEE